MKPKQTRKNRNAAAYAPQPYYRRRVGTSNVDKTKIEKDSLAIEFPDDDPVAKIDPVPVSLVLGADRRNWKTGLEWVEKPLSRNRVARNLE